MQRTSASYANTLRDLRSTMGWKTTDRSSEGTAVFIVISEGLDGKVVSETVAILYARRLWPK